MPETRRTETETWRERGRPDETEPDDTRYFDSARISVGYAPGQMAPGPRIRQDSPTPRKYSREIYGRQMYSREAHERDAKDPAGFRFTAEGPQGSRLSGGKKPKDRKSHPVMWTITSLLLVIGLAAVILLLLPKTNSLRTQASKAVGNLTAPLENALLKKNPEPARIDSFSVAGNEKVTAPTDVIFSVTTDSSVNRLRLVDEKGREMKADLTQAENTEKNYWTLTLRVKD